MLRASLPAMLVLLMLGTPLPAAADVAPVDIPRMAAIEIDGDGADWGDGGFRLDILSIVRGDRPSPKDHDARVRLGWDADGLLLRIDVTDSRLVESTNWKFWDGDSVELFLASAVGGKGCTQYMLSPGLSEQQSELRKRITSHGPPAIPDAGELTVEVARQKTDRGYVLEARLPWSHIGVTPAIGVTAALQVYVTDHDGTGDKVRSVWFPAASTHENTRRMRPFRLAETPSPPVRFAIGMAYDEYFRWIDAKAIARPHLAGKRIDIHQGDRALVTAELALVGDWATATFRVDAPPTDKAFGPVKVSLDGQPMTTAALPPAVGSIARKLVDLAPTFSSHVFGGKIFPQPTFAQPLVAEALLGPHRLSTTYYNAKFEPVTTAANPGRYGAVVQIVRDNGPTLTRYATLYRTPEALDWWGITYDGRVTLPAELGIDPAVAAAQGQEIVEAYKAFGYTADKHLDGVAVLLGGLSEINADAPKVTAFTNASAINRQWWVTLKRKLNGNGDRWADPFAAPRPVTGDPAPVLHDGTMAEAGMVDDAPGRIDAVLTQWAADTDEGFIAVVARNGVVVLHKAYGEQDGEPVTTDKANWMASLTKLMQGTSMMMLVDQGLVDLDAPIATYLPAFINTRPQRPITVRDLFVHTAGMWGHWGDDVSDLDYRVAEYAPYLDVGLTYLYNGMDLAIAGKIMEAVSGESLPSFYRDHLFAPLGMSETTATTGSWDGLSTAMDMARLGQMLCNRGSYGDKRFFTGETADAMLPVKLTMCLGDDTVKVWGIGCDWMSNDVFGTRTFGHGSAASATLRIDLDNGLVVSMTRRTAGTNFETYHTQWLETIADCMVDPALSEKGQAAQAKRRAATLAAE